MKSIIIKNANIHNLKNVSVEIPLNKLVVVVGYSGSGKTSLIYDVLYKSSLGEKAECYISKLPPVYAVGQKVVVPKGLNLSLGEYNLKRLKENIKKLKRGDLLIVDEPCAGFTKNECKNILKLLKKVVSEGKSVIVIEHAKEIIIGADYIIEFGPKSGKYGGEIIFQGSLEKFRKSKTITAKNVFAEKKSVKNPQVIKAKKVTLHKIDKNNFKDFTFTFPLNSLVCVYGKAGSGKSTILDVVYRSLYKGRNAWKIRLDNSPNIIGKQNVRRSYLVDQLPLSDHPTSRPVTYLNVWESIRKIYSDLPVSKKLKLTKSDFIVTHEMLKVKKDFSKDVLSVKYKGLNISELLKLTIDEAIKIFSDIPLVKRKLAFLQEVGLGYLTLGQPSSSLSGGESQRVKLAKVLTKKLGDRCVYILDIPSKGLHLSDLPVLLKIFKKIINKNNTILIAENKEEMINNCDYSINLESI